MKQGSLLMIGIACIALLVGCGEQTQTKAKPLTAEEIFQANDAFVSMLVTDGVGRSSEISCFFTSFYEKPEDIDFEAFMRYCPIGDRLEDTDSEEYVSFLGAEAMRDPAVSEMQSLPVPVSRYPKEAVSSILKKYANITVDDLTNIESVIYLEKYDAFYKMTSDFRPGCFECVGGEKIGDTIRLWSATDENGYRTQLTLAAVDGTYYIHSFQQVKE